MTSSAALPGAAVRFWRTAAGRRALYLALLVGGLFALGLLGGQRAEAAEDGPTALSDASAAAVSVEAHTPELELPEPSAPERPTAQAADAHDRPAPQAADAERGPRPVTERVVPAAPEGLAAPEAFVPAVAERLVPAVDEHVVRPVGEVVGAVTDGLEEARSQAPTLPPLSPPPGLPVLPELPLLPGQTLPAPDLTAPGATAPEPTPAPAPPGDGENSGGPAEDGSSASYGPRFSTSYDAPEPHASAGAHHRADSVGPSPAQHAPGGHPGGAPDHRATVDNGTPRHGDAHGLALNDRTPLLLLAGAAACADADETRDETRDIPVSPA
ncbi:hypothetical protein [Streptomyces sp. NPDC003635]